MLQMIERGTLTALPIPVTTVQEMKASGLSTEIFASI